MKIGIDPTIDFACKRVLGDPQHPSITLHFLNSVLRFPTPIREVRIINPAIEKDFSDDKWSLLDILATDDSGRMYDIEVQTTRPYGLRQRLVYYAARLLVGQLKKGQDYHHLRSSIGICLLDGIEFRRDTDLHHHFQLRNDGGALLTECLQVHLFELPKYEPPGDNQPISDSVDQWLYFFRRAQGSTEEELMSRLPDPVFAEATGVLKMIAKDPEKRWQYEMRLKAERDARAKLQQAIADGLEMGLEQGVAQGLEKGLEQGREKGLAEGLAEGELIGRVKLLQSLNGDTPAASEDLQKLGRQQLTELESELQSRLNKLLGRQ